MATFGDLAVDDTFYTAGAGSVNEVKVKFIVSKAGYGNYIMIGIGQTPSLTAMVNENASQFHLGNKHWFINESDAIAYAYQAINDLEDELYAQLEFVKYRKDWFEDTYNP